jgi:hypothetical protein
MKIEIISPLAPFTHGYEIECNGKRLHNVNAGMHPKEFSEEEIEFLLGGDYTKFEQGKYQFNIPKWKLDAIEGKMLTTDRYSLVFATEYQEL